MRIAMVVGPTIDVPPKKYGGIELVVFDLVEALVQQRHQVTLYATGRSRTRGRLRSYFDRPPKPDILTALDHITYAMQDVLHQGRRFDLVHVHSCPEAIPFARHLRIPMIYTIRNSWMQTPIYMAGYRRHPEVTFVAQSQLQYQLLRRLYPKWPRLRLATCGLDPNRYRSSLRSSGYLLFLGQLGEHKGAHIAIDAAARLGLPIVVAGAPITPRDQEYFEREIRPRLTPAVRMVGAVNHAQKTRWLRGAAVTLCPFLGPETFGLVPLESALCGTPVVAYPRGAAPEIVRPDLTGFLAEDLDALVEGVRKALHLSRTGCRDFAAKNFSALTMTKRYLEIYRAELTN